MDGFYCNSCGQYHDHLPMSYGVSAPIYWSNEFTNDKNSELGQDICIIKGEYFFIKGNVEIPIRDTVRLQRTIARSLSIIVLTNTGEVTDIGRSAPV